MNEETSQETPQETPQDSVPVSVILSARNNEGTIRNILERVPNGIEKIVIDQDSNDATAWLAKDCGARVFSINNTNQDAFSHAIKSATGDMIVFMDANGLHGPEQIPEMVNTLSRGYDIVLGERASFPGFADMTMSWLAKRRIKNVNDASSTFRAVWRKRLLRIDPYESVGPIMLLKMRKLGMNITTMTIPSGTLLNRQVKNNNIAGSAYGAMRLLYHVIFF